MSTINDLLARVHDLEAQVEALRSQPAPDRFRATLLEYDHPERPGLEVVIDCSDGAITLRFQGYGTRTMPEGQGEPLMVEFYEGELRVVAWADINQEDSTHTISLEPARESLRAG